MISISGVRGVVGDGLTPDMVTGFAAAFGEYCGRGKIIVGRDTRTTGEMLRHATLAGLLSVGCDVQDCGIVPTPTIQLAVEKSDAVGGIAITASHNPAPWNALKFFSRDGLFLDERQAAEVFSLRERWQEACVAWDHMGHVSEYPAAIEEHISAVLGCPLFDLPAIRKRNFKVAVDTVCGAGGKAIPQLLAELGCEVVKINSELSGLFPHNPEPLPENIQDLCRLVRDNGCDVGFAVDPDADRLAIVDEAGHPLGEENTLVLATRLVLSKQRGPVVANVSTTQALDDIAQQFDAPIHRTKVGEIHVVRKMQEVKAVIGGEGNGGVIFPGVHLARDAAVGVAMALQSLVESGGSLSGLMGQLPHYEIAKRKIPIGNLNAQDVLAQLSRRFSKEELDHTDGLKVLRSKEWFQVRASNTEPILRVYAEAPTMPQAEKLAQDAVQEIEKMTRGRS
jgi:phosphomannomutase